MHDALDSDQDHTATVHMAVKIHDSGGSVGNRHRMPVAPDLRVWLHVVRRHDIVLHGVSISRLCAIASLQRGVQEVLMRMFPYTGARLKADIQRAACSEVGMQTPAQWQTVAVSI